MQIDDPIGAAKQLDESERRSEMIPFKEETAAALVAFPPSQRLLQPEP
jgi:hypothetical protein